MWQDSRTASAQLGEVERLRIDRFRFSSGKKVANATSGTRRDRVTVPEAIMSEGAFQESHLVLEQKP